MQAVGRAPGRFVLSRASKTPGGSRREFCAARAMRRVALAGWLLASLLGPWSTIPATSQVPLPAVARITPQTGAAGGGMHVLITGSGFQDTTSVKFGGVESEEFTVKEGSSTEPGVFYIFAKTPSLPAGPVLVTVTTPLGISSSNPAAQFTYVPAAGGEWNKSADLAFAPTDSGSQVVAMADGKVLLLSKGEAQVYDPASQSWRATGAMKNDLEKRAAAPIGNKVLVAGGGTGLDAQTAAEIYDASTNEWSGVAPMLNPRNFFSLTAMGPPGCVCPVLAVGGRAPAPSAIPDPGHPARVQERITEIYDPATDTWSETGKLEVARQDHVAVRFPDGRVLVAGGHGRNSDPSPATSAGLFNKTLDSAEIYDPGSAAWSTAGSLANARHWFTEILLPTGHALVSGGYGSEQCVTGCTALSSSELFDPVATDLTTGRKGAWRPTGILSHARQQHAMAALAGGKVIVAGGVHGRRSLEIADSAEIYDPLTERWTYTSYPLTSRGAFPGLAALPSGRVLAAGGFVHQVETSVRTEIFTPSRPPVTVEEDLPPADPPPVDPGPEQAKPRDPAPPQEPVSIKLPPAKPIVQKPEVTTFAAPGATEQSRGFGIPPSGGGFSTNPGPVPTTSLSLTPAKQVSLAAGGAAAMGVDAAQRPAPGYNFTRLNQSSSLPGAWALLLVAAAVFACWASPRGGSPAPEHAGARY